MRQAWTWLVWLSVAASVFGFFLPWIHLDLRESKLADVLRQMSEHTAPSSGRITATLRVGGRTITGTLPTAADLPRQVTGAQMPSLVHRQDAQTAVAIIELLTNRRWGVGARSYAVYLVPGVALLGGLLLLWRRTGRAVALSLAAVYGGSALIGCWKLLTLDARALPITVTVGLGLWLCLAGYVGLAVAATSQAVGRVR